MNPSPLGEGFKSQRVSTLQVLLGKEAFQASPCQDVLLLQTSWRTPYIEKLWMWCVFDQKVDQSFVLSAIVEIEPNGQVFPGLRSR